ncbi:hypothetical protein BKA70DRAFT_1562635 [Coprinopsis sp. MPI-PUGE-AT-0042]|nr:hypothetical protein BKA70DRAFT_1562635 [Coprinopsis sp. MPI-PUGE-AT-0042]
MARLPLELIQAARSGNVDKLHELGDRITAENYTLAVLSAALVHLELEDLSIDESQRTHLSRIKRAFSAFHCVNQILSCCSRTQALKTATSGRLQPQLEGILVWMSRIVSTIGGTPAFISVSLALSRLLHLDEDISMQLCTSQRAFNLFIDLWRYQPPWDEPPTAYLKPGLINPIHTAFHAYLTHQAGMQTFCDQILSSRRHLAYFLDSLVIKSRRLSTSPGEYAKCGEIRREASLLALIYQMVDIQGLVPMAKRSRCLKDLGAMTTSLRPFVSPEDFLIDSAGLFGISDASRDIAPILESGILAKVVEAFPNSDWGDDPKLQELGDEIIASLAAASCYPRSLKALHKAVPLIELPTVKRDGSRNQWISLFGSIYDRMDALQSANRDILPCDNDMHASDVHPDSCLPIKACSGCSFMAYCSVACQRSDWIRKHRMECSEIRRCMGDRNVDAIQLSQSTKAFHLTLVTAMFNNPAFQAACDNEHRELYPTEDGSMLIISMDTTDPAPYQKALVLWRLDQWYERVWQPGNCPALDLRALVLMKDMTMKVSPKVMLMEAVFEWDMQRRLSLLIEFEEDGDGAFRPGRGVLRVVHNAEQVPDDCNLSNSSPWLQEAQR